jgi:hypothetical protein
MILTLFWRHLPANCDVRQSDCRSSRLQTGSPLPPARVCAKKARQQPRFKIRNLSTYSYCLLCRLTAHAWLGSIFRTQKVRKRFRLLSFPLPSLFFALALTLPISFSRSYSVDLTFIGFASNIKCACRPKSLFQSASIELNGCVYRRGAQTLSF